MNMDAKLNVAEIQRFCMHDGPGIRTTVFLKGCPLRCAWCHNPEMQKYGRELLFYQTKCIGCHLCESYCIRGAHSFESQHLLNRPLCAACGRCADECPTNALAICGKEYTVKEILSEIEKDRAFFGEKGGVTLSGGEPLSQGESVIDLLRVCKESGLSTAVETCGYADEQRILSAVPYVDLFLWDVKDTDGERHKKYTGVSNERILNNLILADANGAKTRLRCILINGINTTDEHYRSVANIASSLANCEGVEWIPYHAYSGAKATFIGGIDNGRKEWIPTPEQMDKAKEILRCAGVNSF